MTTIKQFYIYYDGKLPDKGWFQCCVTCDTITSKLHYYKNITTLDEDEVEIYSYLCNKCKKKLSDKQFFKDYEINCEELISDNIMLIDPLNQIPHSP